VTTEAVRPDRAPRRAPQRWESSRLLLTPPVLADARDIFARFASDNDVTRYLSWPRHRTVADSDAFVQFSLDEWSRRPAGPYLIRDRRDGRLIGSTGLAVHDEARAMTGYVLARDAWGRGYATEALTAMVQIAAAMGLEELSALCHAEHQASIRVLEKCGFSRDTGVISPMCFPNSALAAPQPVVRYSRRTPAVIA
jgi:[ribosomal protein S5]-alanine N-acetyltransferase